MSLDAATRAFRNGDLAAADRHLANDLVGQACVVAATRSRVRAQALLPSISFLGDGVVAFVRAVAGEQDVHLRRDLLVENSISAQFAVEAVLLLHETSLAADAIAVMQSVLTRHPMLCPVPVVVGELYLLVGRVDDAIERVEAGLSSARSINAVPHVANAASVLARALDARGAPGDRDRAVLLAAEAHELWHRCSIV